MRPTLQTACQSLLSAITKWENISRGSSNLNMAPRAIHMCSLESSTKQAKKA